MNSTEMRSKVAHIAEALEIGDELFWEPSRQARPGAWSGHLATAFWLIKAVKPRIFVELGSHSGNSYLAFCQAIAQLGLSSRSFAVDTWQGDEHSGPYDETVFTDLHTFNASHFPGFSKLLRTTFDDARSYFADGTVDLLHIDGCHSYEVVKHDFETWRNALSSRAVVVFHDTNVRERGFGVWRLWRELSEHHPSFEFYHSEGLGILGVGESQSPLLRRLFELGRHAEDRAVVQQLFATRGETFVSRARSLDLESELTELRERVHELTEVEREISLSKAILREQEEEIQVKAAVISRLELEIGSKDKRIAEHERRIAERQLKVAELENVVDKLRSDFASVERLLQNEESQSAARVLYIEELRENLATVQRQLGLIESSTTWKIISHIRSALADHPQLRRFGGRMLRLVWWTVTLQLLDRMRGRRRLFEARDKIAGSDFFDSAWYLSRYPDVANQGMDPALHYALFGAAERRSPGPRFDAVRYLELYPDVAKAGLNPLLHYLEFGASEGRQVAAIRDSGTDSSVECEPQPGASEEPQVDAIAASVPQLNDGDDYGKWIAQYDSITDSDKNTIAGLVSELPNRPLISIVMPVYNTRPEFLRKALDSVVGQLYPNWELCIADDASTEPEIRTILDGYARRDRRIKLVYRNENGHISAASNSALEMASGTFIALMDHDDELPVHALFMVASALNEYPDADIIYSDEDKIDNLGVRQTPYFKPDWNQELFYSQNYLSHLGVYRATLVREVGSFRRGYEGSQDYDLALRIVARTTANRIHHIPHVLYHWRTAAGVQTFSISSLSTAVQSSRRALADYFANRGGGVQVTGGKIPHYNRVLRRVPIPQPRVSLIIPTRDRVSMLRGCVDGILHRTAYDNMEIIVVDNESCEEPTIEYLESLRQEHRVRVLRMEGEFNYSALNNRAVRVAEGELIALINNDVQVIHPEWLQEMVAQVAQDGVGAVGAKLYYPDNTIQHAGVILGLGGIAGHSHVRRARADFGYFGRLQLVQDVSCVTGACMLLKKRLFLEVGELDEVNLKVAFNDVDLCLRVRKAGYRIVWTPYAELYHLESISRGCDLEPIQAERVAREAAVMLERWGQVLENDPLYNPNLSLAAGEDHKLAFPPRVKKPWLHCCEDAVGDALQDRQAHLIHDKSNTVC